MNQNKSWLIHIGILILFIAVSYSIYPALLKGKVVKTHDATQWQGGAKEGRDYYSNTGELAQWSNSMFGGMPFYFLFSRNNSNIVKKYVYPILKMGMPKPVYYLLISMVGFYILLLSMKISPLPSAAGGIAFALNSYNLVVLNAGHDAKVGAIMFIPFIFLGIRLIYQRKYLVGVTLVSLFMSFELIANHPQMTYYFFVFFIGIYLIFKLVEAIKTQQLKQFFIASGIFAGALILAVGVNADNLLPTQEYSKYSTRGKSELKTENPDKTSGLDRSYIVNWSNGIGETWSLLVPTFKGEESGAFGAKNKALKGINPTYKSVVGQLDKYWGDQPIIGGPMYLGAVVFFLFVFGIFIINEKYKWIILISTGITVMLGWGKNFMGLTDIFIDYFPLYNKFRAVASIQTVAHFAMALLATLALGKAISSDWDWNKTISEKSKITRKKALIISGLLTGGLSILMAIMPHVFNTFFKTGEESKLLAQFTQSGFQPAQANATIDALGEARKNLFTADAWRSGLFIIGAFVSLFLLSIKKINGKVATIIVLALLTIDLAQVGKRFTKDKIFVSKSKTKAIFSPKPTKADQIILADQDPYYRVLNLTVSPFNDATTSFLHKSIGGYHGAKMGIYNELIEAQLYPEINEFSQLLRSQGLNAMANTDVLNMMNTKYVILSPENPPLKNSHAFGNAWFVSNIKEVSSANEELDALGTTDLRTTAVIRNNKIDTKLGSGSIELTSYKPDELTYTSNSQDGGLALFSEIYYPEGWTATIDGKEVSIHRANYVLRALEIPAGKHEVKMIFRSASFAKGVTISLVSNIFILAIVALTIFKNKDSIISFFKGEKTEVETK